MNLSDSEDSALALGLTEVARRLQPPAERIGALRRLSAGASQETWSFVAIDGEGARRALVLRRMPRGERPGDLSPGPEKEAAAMTLAAKAGVPVPAVRYVLTPADGLGRGFIMDHIEGETLGHRIARAPSFAGARAVFADQVGAALARIHGIDAASIDLRLTTPIGEIEDLFERYQASATLRPVFEMAFAWLRRHPPPPAPTVLIHGDFRNGNLIVAPHGIVAILDWELMHLGDPLEDLGWLCVNSWRFGQIDLPAGGVTSREALFEAYEQASGRSIDRAAAHFWEVLGVLRWGVMCAAMVDWVHAGQDASIERCMIARRASETEIDLMRLLAPMGARHA